MRQLIYSSVIILIAGFIAVTPIKPAKADGGATAVIVGGYLVTDYVVGRKCHIRHWPFNIIKKVTRKKRCHRYRKRHRHKR